MTEETQKQPQKLFFQDEIDDKKKTNELADQKPDNQFNSKPQSRKETKKGTSKELGGVTVVKRERTLKKSQEESPFKNMAINTITEKDDIEHIGSNENEDKDLEAVSDQLSNSVSMINEEGSHIEDLENVVKDEMIEEENTDQISKQKKTIKKKVEEFLNNSTLTILMSIITIWVLFADDIRMLATSMESDDTFTILNIVFMSLFFIEYLISCYALPNYLFSFFFWLDLISVISMVLDIQWFYTFIINEISGNLVPGSKIKAAASIAKAGRGAKIGSRAVKILRVLRIIRLVRISRLYKASTKLGKNKKGAIEPQLEESKIGKKLTELTTKRVIILVLSMIIGIIVFNSSFYYSTLNSIDFGMKIFNEISNPDDPTFSKLFNAYIEIHTNISTPILYADVYHFKYELNTTEIQLRFDEMITAQESCDSLSLIDNNIRCFAIFDNRIASQTTALINIIKTLFICMMLTGGTICFSQDTSELVLDPLESIIEKIKKISKNPIAAMEENEKNDYMKKMYEGKNDSCCGKKHDKSSLETTVLEKTITKIGALMALGFGEAGSKIIVSNMSNKNSTEIDPMIKGKKVMAIYGFCDIRNFTDTTEVLEEQVMIFVNEIAEIVHEITVDHGGSANKNIGDAFLLVWKFEEEHCEFDSSGELVGLKKNKVTSEIVDSSVIAFLKILAKVHKSFKLDKYRRNPGLNNRIKNYAVKMGFGLHLGWSIEGAIGSTFKIDASYLSPHVNVSGKLEEKTKEYGALMIVSGDLVDHMTDLAKNSLRVIDRVSLIEGKEMNLYTVDINLQSLKIEEVDVDLEKNDIMNKFDRRVARKELITSMMEGNSNMWKDYEETDEDWVILRQKYPQEFFEEYFKGYTNYIEGNWILSKSQLEKAQSILGDMDRPSIRILNKMGKHGFNKPSNWSVLDDDEE